MYLTFRQLQYFVEIVDAENMTRAAGRLHVAPTALSHQIKTLEARLGYALLERHSRGVSPTKGGVELYDRSREILSMIEKTESSLSRPADAGKKLRIGVVPSIAHIAGFDLATIPKWRGTSPVIEIVEGVAASLQAGLLNGDIDLLFSGDLAQSRTMQSIKFMREHLVFAYAADAGKPHADLKDVLASGLVFIGDDSNACQLVRNAAKARGLAWNAPRVVQSLDVIRQLVIHGKNTTVIPFGLVKEGVSNGVMAVSRIVDYPLVRAINLSGTLKGLARARSDGVVEQLLALVKSAHLRVGPYYEPVTAASDLPE